MSVCNHMCESCSLTVTWNWSVQKVHDCIQDKLNSWQNDKQKHSAFKHLKPTLSIESMQTFLYQGNELCTVCILKHTVQRWHTLYQPVMRDSSTLEQPLMTVASTGIFSPGTTLMVSPRWTSSTDISSSLQEGNKHSLCTCLSAQHQLCACTCIHSL